jgi:hypothetical protein
MTYVARLKGHAASTLGDRHSRASGQNAGKLALATRVEMHDDNESRLDIVGQAFEKHLQGVDATGGRSNANRWKPLPRRLLAHSPRVFGRADPMIIIAHL